MLTSKHIDPHVHCRDWEESHKSTIKSVMEIAKSQNVCAIFDMPNTKPPIVSQELVEKRIDRAREHGCLEGYYLYIGITNNHEQIKEAIESVETNPRTRYAFTARPRCCDGEEKTLNNCFSFSLIHHRGQDSIGPIKFQII